MDESKDKFVLVCNKNGKELKCNFLRKDELEEKCKTYKETGVGLTGPILNVKRVCEVKNIKDIIKMW